LLFGVLGFNFVCKIPLHFLSLIDVLYYDMILLYPSFRGHVPLPLRIVKMQQSTAKWLTIFKYVTMTSPGWLYPYIDM